MRPADHHADSCRLHLCCGPPVNILLSLHRLRLIFLFGFGCNIGLFVRSKIRRAIICLSLCIIPLVFIIRRPRGILARVLSACGGFSRQRRGSRAKDYSTKLLAYSSFDSYKLNGEDSQLHWEQVTARSHRHVKLLQLTSTGLVLIIGFRRRDAC